MVKYDRNDYMTKLVHIGNQVEYVLENYPDTRSSDRALEVRVWELFYGVVMLRDLLRKKIPPSSSIRRWRRRYNNWGRYIPTEDHVERRRNNEYEYYKEFKDERRAQ